MSTARPSVTKKQREQKKREKQAMKAERRAQRKLASHDETTEPADEQFETPEAAS
ncbi:MAG TPA: hypothetical protein VF980_20505 [Thermoanaerobaculia bacterium]